MATSRTPDYDTILSAIPHKFRGPGGSLAIIKDGSLVAHRSYGYANLDERAPMTPDTLIPVCSISKQMVCLTLMSLVRDPTPAMLARKEEPWRLFQDELERLLPGVMGREGEELKVEHLCNMQSGIRDYWAMTTLYGARPDGLFSIARDAPQALERVKSFHFPPGTSHSYSNVNFHIIGKILENVAGQSLGQLLTERVFIPAGMSSAALCPNTNGLPQPIIGYEGDESVGFFPAVNRIEWAGDAGVVASLNDMIAYEKYLDRSWSESSSLYHDISKKQTFKDGTEAPYSYGLFHVRMAGKDIIGHGGALRGFRLLRMHIPPERLSVVVMFNHEIDVGEVSDHILKRIYGHKDEAPLIPQVDPQWEGDFLEETTQLSLHVEKSGPDEPGKISLRYEADPESFKLKSKFVAESDNARVELDVDGDVLHITRKDENVVQRAKRIARPNDGQVYNANSSDYVGSYRCEEVDSTFHCTGEDGTLYGSFDGFLGKGPIWLMRYIGKDVWVLGTPRGMDAGPPGDWTMVFRRGEDGNVRGVTVGCWLARKVEFVRQTEIPLR